MKRFALLVLIVLATPAFSQTTQKEGLKLAWLPWGDQAFAQAKREHRFVLLDLEAVWCHWCHVMDETTYLDPKVIALLRSHYVAVKADQDLRPDLSNRYEDYGWPATVVFDSDGHEIIKRQGYLPPLEFANILQAIIDDPSPGPSVQPETAISFPSNPLLPDKLREEIRTAYLAGYDTKQGGWGFDTKFLDWDSVEYAMNLAARGDAQNEKMARDTLKAQLNLVDPVWGGVYQYSTDDDWVHPHFEKIMSMQAEDMRIYSQAYARWQDPTYLNAAVSIHRFLTTFLLSPTGAFYTSQDADVIRGQHSGEYFRLEDAGRRKQGVPRVDKHIYARENGWAIAALASLYASTGNKQYLDEAARATRWIVQNRSLPGGGFRHDTEDVAGPYLGDSLAMARAFLALYGCTGDRQRLAETEKTMAFIERNFRDADGAGYLTTKAPTDRAYKPHPQRDENVMLARITNLLFPYTANAAYRKMTDQAMRYLAAPPIARRLPAASVLLVDYDVVRAPLHLTIVGKKDDPGAQELFLAALRYPSGYKRLEWWDKREGKLPNPDVQYPELPKPAAFVCTDRVCSQPIFKPDDIKAKVDKLSSLQGRS
ncbi:MAG: DUF255 domain-containing protein [Candidatus Acidiferrales bacterium]